MRKDETNRYVGTLGGPVDDRSMAGPERKASDTRTAGSGSVASNATTGTNATVRFVATKPGTSSASLSQHGADIALWQSFMTAQQACCSWVAFPTVRHSADDTTTRASARALAIGRTICSSNLDINV